MLSVLEYQIMKIHVYFLPAASLELSQDFCVLGVAACELNAEIVQSCDHSSAFIYGAATDIIGEHNVPIFILEMTLCHCVKLIKHL